MLLITYCNSWSSTKRLLSIVTISLFDIMTCRGMRQALHRSPLPRPCRPPVPRQSVGILLATWAAPPSGWAAGRSRDRPDWSRESSKRRDLVKIAYIVTRADPIGGAQIHVRDLAEAMRDRGHSVLILVGGTGPFVDDLRSRGLETLVLRHLTVPIRPLQDLRAFRELRAALVAFGSDLVAAHSAKAGVIGRMVARTLGVPVVVTTHGWSFTTGVPPLRAAVYRWIERATSPLSADKTITVSEYDRQLALRAHILPARRMVTVHNGMPDVAPSLRAD